MLKFGWGDYDETYIVLTFKEKWTSDEFAQIVSDLYSQIKAIQRTIHIFIDLRYSAPPPVSILGIVVGAIRTHPPNMGRVIVLSQSNIWKRLYDIATIHRPDRSLDIHFVRNVDYAYNLLVTASN